MQVSKWGDDLAVRIPSSVAEALELREGDQVEIRVTSNHPSDANKQMTREEALEGLRKLRRPFPPDFKFNREEANER